MLKYTIVQKNKARGDKTWYGRVFDTQSKKVQFVSLATGLKYVAEEWMRTRITEEMTGKKDVSGVTVERAAAEYLHTYDGRTNYENTRILMNYVKVYCADNRIGRFTDLSPAACLELFAQLGKLSAVTRRRMLTMCRSWWRWCVRVYEIRGFDNPFDLVRIERPTPAERAFWTPEQLVLWLDAFKSPEDRLAAAFMSYEGLRIHEALKVKGSDMRDGKLYVLGKGKKFASLPIGSKMQEELDRFGHIPQGYIFAHRSTSTWGNKLLRMAAKHPELDFGGKAHPHRFRHSFISNLIRANVNLKAVQQLARHANINITLNLYAHLIPNDLEEAINKI